MIMLNTHGIQKKTDYEHIRLRTNMYLGSCDPHTQTVLNYNNLEPILEETTWVPALYTCLREIIDNALDELIGHGHGKTIEIKYDKENMIFSVHDDGRGIPFDWSEDYKAHLATLVLTEPRAGRNFGERGEVAGTNGIGASAVSITAEWAEIDIRRDNKKFYQMLREGNELFNEIQIEGAKITKSNSDVTGTTYRFKPSKIVYKHMILPEFFVRSRITEIAIANPTIRIVYNGEFIKVKSRPDLSLFGNRNYVTVDIKDTDFRSRFWIVPNFVPSGDHSHTLVNNISAFNGGVHVEQFRKIFFANLLIALEKESKKRKLSPNRSDIIEGILLYNITTMKSPDFDSQSKTRLINESVAVSIKQFLDNEDLYKNIIKSNKEWIDQIYARCSERTQKKDAGDVAKLARRAMRNKVPGLTDANGTKRHECILFLAEGNSAIAGLASVRDPDIHGGLGLRGKVMNVNGEHPKTILDNKCLVEIMNAIGLVIGQRANRHELRYGKIYLATDMDEDGKNIAALLINFFHTYWPELFDEKQKAFIYVFQTPFVIAEKSKQRKYWYAHDYAEFKPENWSGWAITRAKGLGTLTEEDWSYSLKNPVSVPIIDDGNMKEALELIFDGKNADLRKQWIGL